MATEHLIGDRGRRSKVGRPARVDRSMIAEAAAEIGLEDVTVKKVADRLGMSVTGLYYYVHGREELVRLAAERSAANMRIPVDTGQHWSAWLLEWARYSYDEFVAQPALLGEFVVGSLGVERMLVHVDGVLAVLTRQGFAPQEAMRAFRLVSRCALGAAVDRMREAETARAGRSMLAEYHRVLAESPDNAFPHLRRLVDSGHDGDDDLAEQVTTVLVGIAARRGEPWEGIIALNDRGSVT